MSTNLNYKQVTNVARRTWDRESYEQKAKARLAAQQEQQEQNSSDRRRPKQKQAASSTTSDKTTAVENKKEEFRPAAPGAAGPEGSQRAFLKARTAKVQGIDEKVGTTEFVSAEQAAATKSSSSLGGGDDDAKRSNDVVVKTGIGWHCKVCDCFLKDSHTYLDHINGRKHQRKLGYSMRVERSTKDQVMNKLKLLKQQQSQQSQSEEALESTTTNYEDVVQAKDRQAQQRKEERQRKRQERKKRLAQEQEKQEEEEDDEDDVEAQVDPAMAAMMGFSNFGGGT